LGRGRGGTRRINPYQFTRGESLEFRPEEGRKTPRPRLCWREAQTYRRRIAAGKRALNHSSCTSKKRFTSDGEIGFKSWKGQIGPSHRRTRSMEYETESAGGRTGKCSKGPKIRNKTPKYCRCFQGKASARKDKPPNHK